jgi:hypothetical protein
MPIPARRRIPAQINLSTSLLTTTLTPIYTKVCKKAVNFSDLTPSEMNFTFSSGTSRIYKDTDGNDAMYWNSKGYAPAWI